MTPALVRARKRDQLAAEYAEVLEVLEPDVDFAAVGGHAQAKAYLRDCVVGPLRAGAAEMVPLGIALLGPPGTGKTLLARALARESGLNCVLLRAEKIKGSLVGESERRLAKALGGIEALAPAIVFVDEIDQRFARGSGGGDGGSAVEANIFARLLEFLSDTAHRGRIVAIAATNRPDLVDPALFRPGRFDTKIPLLPPETAAARAEVLAALLRRAGWSDPDDLALAAVGERSEGWTQAELERAVTRATGLARLRGLELGAALAEAVDTLRPATRGIRRMVELALAACDDASLVPERYRELVGAPAGPEVRAGESGEAGEPGGRGRRARALDL